MSITSAVILSSVVMAGRGTGVNWDFSITTSGENILWTGADLLPIDGEYYEMLYTVNRPVTPAMTRLSKLKKAYGRGREEK